MVPLPLVRRLGALVEAVHAVVYFAPEPQQGYAGLGLRGYWRGYFASRTAALGRPSASLVTAVLGGFAPAMVVRAVPEVWSLVEPEDVLRARQDGAAAALHRLLEGRDAAPAADLLLPALDLLPLSGRPLAAAHLALPVPAEPVARLWHLCTVLREHRGDGHLAAVAAAGMRWPEPHLLAEDRLDARQQQHRGWSDAEWNAARERVAGLDRAAVADDLERATDALAADAWTGVDAERAAVLLAPLAAAAATQLPFPNAMGLPRLLDDGEQPPR